MEAPASEAVMSWDAVLALGNARPDDIAERVAALEPDDVACIIYTSGTGGLPKGVLATHRNILANCRGAYQLLEMLGLGDEVFLSFLPLSHSYEHTAGTDVPDLDRRADLFRRGRRYAGRQPARGAADDHDRGAAAL